MITIYEASERFFISRVAFYKAIKRGDIRCEKVAYKRDGFKYMISIEDAQKVASGYFQRGNNGNNH